MRRLLPILLLLALGFLVLAAASPPYLKREIVIRLDEEEIVKATLRTDLSHAMRAERAGGYEKLYRNLLDHYDAKDALNYLAIGLGDRLYEICETRQIDAVDATLMRTGTLSVPFLYQEGKPGREADLSEVGAIVARAIDQKDIARAYTHEVPPTCTKKDLMERTQEIGRFSTGFRTSGENRRCNIALAADAISGCRIEAGECFSFNTVVGERSAERGFREANVVVDGRYVRGVGGGVCQVSTTLYNAALLAGLPIERAAAHSIPVSYVPCSRDCTVSSAIDFVFRNDTPYPVYIAAEIEDSTLTFVLYGKPKGEKIRLESEIVERIPYRALYEDGSEVLDPTVATLLVSGTEGIRSRLYAVKETPNGVTHTLIRENLYAKRDAIYQRDTDAKNTHSSIVEKEKATERSLSFLLGMID